MPKFVIAAVGAASAWALHTACAAPPLALNTLGSSYVTPAASAELAQICPAGQGYPAQTRTVRNSPTAATSGVPKIEQYRQGALIATYSSLSDQPGCTMAGDGTDNIHPAAPAASGCGPFTREHTFRLWQAGDTFLVYPAVYAGPYNQPWIGPEFDDGADYVAGIFHTPDNIVLQGVVQNNMRPVILLNQGASTNTLNQAPVYFDQSTGFTMDSIDVVSGPGAGAGKAGVYNSGASNLTLRRMRVSGFARTDLNGLFGAGNYSGSLLLDEVELDHNGGPDGPSHNAYIGASVIDPNYTVVMQHSWSHDAFYGHLFKSRAQVNVFVANYFEGGRPTGGHTQAEAYLLDVPNGGRLTVRNNVFVKNASGPNSNGMSVSFLMEGMSDGRPQSVDLENNTFVTFAETYDGTHPNYPLSFLYRNVRPDDAAWPASIPVRVIKNAFIGYCAAPDGGPQSYHGDLALTESFTETSKSFAFSTKVISDDRALAAQLSGYQPELGTPVYAQQIQKDLLRQRMTVGAKD